ncbi:TetR/AcrR family transcriptional regulator [Saccharothrix obliqua]|uniref:TetR/AcrR family transcriptional regulator n=1 Tax=Saccharothrix obliqua TaxID=2861747 RepID=UPI001C5DDA0C|nr:TetR/AcrR family transcriptional regulator [Saccharothrix obliqua]MBW4716883.1 TetR/AcrR family transcriptional regulator [Saccharothrix obliqua]
MSRSRSDTRARAQAVARELFLKQGLGRTSLQDIADRLGITKPALYYHFASREDLVRSIVQPLVDDGGAFVADAERARPTPRALLEGFFALHHRHREVVTLVVQELSSLQDVGLVELIWEWRQRLGLLLVGPEPSLVDEVRATVALGGLADCVMVYPDAPYDEVCAAGVEAALAALGPSLRNGPDGTR